MIYSSAIILITLVIDILTDLRLWMNKKTINHTRGALLRLIGFIPACWLTPAATGLFLAVYFVLFNGILAVLKGLPWLYIGTTSKLDRLLNRMPKWGYVALQAAVLAGGVIWYIKAR